MWPWVPYTLAVCSWHLCLVVFLLVMLPFFFFTSPSLRQDLGLIHLFNYGDNNNSLVFKVIIMYWALC